jgi:hypothetical protein
MHGIAGDIVHLNVGGQRYEVIDIKYNRFVAKN